MATDVSHSESVEKIVQIRRCACVVKGGRRFSFAALVVVDFVELVLVTLATGNRVWSKN